MDIFRYENLKLYLCTVLEKMTSVDACSWSTVLNGGRKHSNRRREQRQENPALDASERQILWQRDALQAGRSWDTRVRQARPFAGCDTCGAQPSSVRGHCASPETSGRGEVPNGTPHLSARARRLAGARAHVPRTFRTSARRQRSILLADNEVDTPVQDPPVGQPELLRAAFLHHRVHNDVLVRGHPASSQAEVQQAADAPVHRLWRERDRPEQGGVQLGDRGRQVPVPPVSHRHLVLV